ncbi:MAG: hypothetical protein HBSAPP03_07910 [Phycisphaerae bacterium]|nr:MAG: hypothetical protein HBSAPP03_07910 [Phycisphaerae bacterium]
MKRGSNTIRPSGAARLIAALSLAAGVPAATAGTFFAVVAASLAGLPPPEAPPENPVTESKRVLGKILFWDEQLSSDNTMSCGSCHMPEVGSVHPSLQVSPGADGIFGTDDDGHGTPGVIRTDVNGRYDPSATFGCGRQVTNRIAPPVIMAAYFPELRWDGSASSTYTNPQTGQVVIPEGGSLESQSGAPVLNHLEMSDPGRTWAQVGEKLARVRPMALATNLPADVAAVLGDGVMYGDLFAAAFGDSEVNAQRMAFALATYQRTLVPDQTPFDAFMAGDTGALTASQQQGLAIFNSTNSACLLCHQGDTFTDGTFANIGVRPPAEDLGRQLVTGVPSHRGKFKTPSLRNVGLRGRYMHNGRFASVAQVVQFYAQNPGAPERFPDNLDHILQFIVITPAQVPPLTNFLNNALTDPRVANKQFPFDRPTLFFERNADHLELLPDTGVPGAGDMVPAMIAVTPPMIGNQEFKLGVYNALANAPAWVVMSASPPVNGRVPQDTLLGPYTLGDSPYAGGYATHLTALAPGAFADGQVIYAQWIITDPAAAGGQAASQAVRITFFCPRGGCPLTCDADVNCDGAINGVDVEIQELAVGGDMADYCQPDADFNQDGAINGTDVEAVELVVGGGACP